MRMYLDPQIVGEILVIENCDPMVAPFWRDAALKEYGPLAGLVRFIQASFFGPIPPAAGWWTQQVLKILVARTVGFPRYVVLDTKSHLVGTLGRSFLESPDGKMSTRRYGYHGHPLQKALGKALEYCDVPVGNHVDLFLPTAPPFTMDTASVLEVIAFVERKEGKTFAEAFIARELTEFFLYAARLVKLAQIENLYSFGQVPCPVVWENSAEPLPLLSVIREADERLAPVFALHRRAIPKLDALSREIIAQFWVRRGLFSSVGEPLKEFQRVCS